MPIISTDIQYRYSGGVANTTAGNCLGGIMSTNASGVINDNFANNLFDDVTAAESASGDVEYRGFYIRNINATLTLTDARIYILTDTTCPTEEVDIALAVEAMNVTMATIPDESTAPVGVSFSHPTSYATGLQLNGGTGLIAGGSRGVWIRRAVGANTVPVTGNTFTLRVEGTST